MVLIYGYLIIYARFSIIICTHFMDTFIIYARFSIFVSLLALILWIPSLFMRNFLYLYHYWHSFYGYLYYLCAIFYNSYHYWHSFYGYLYYLCAIFYICIIIGTHFRYTFIIYARFYIIMVLILGIPSLFMLNFIFLYHY